jgi:hypothetical protein
MTWEIRFYDVGSSGLDPLAVFAEAGVGAAGANERVGGGKDAGGFLEQVLEHGAEIPAALGEQAKRAGVAVDGGDVGQTKVVGDVARTVPADEIEIDHLAIGMIADGAFATVTLQGGTGRIAVLLVRTYATHAGNRTRG